MRVVKLIEIDKYYMEISKKYSCEIIAQENIINRLGYNYLKKGKINNAIEIFKENVKRFPNSPNVYDSLGEAYEKNKQIKLAKLNYQKAYELGIKQNHKATLLYKKNMKRVSK